jgi:hypothetical protein
LFLCFPESTTSQSASPSLAKLNALWNRITRIGETSSLIQSLCKSFLSRLCQVPKDNLQNIASFRDELEHIGFIDIKIEDISDNMFEGFSSFVVDQYLTLGSLTNPRKWIKFRVTAALLRAVHCYRLGKFVLISAKKPES